MADGAATTEDLPKLTKLQEAFVDFFLGAGDGSGRFRPGRAATMAGYAAPGVEACRLLKNANVLAHIDRLLSLRALSRDQALDLVVEDALRTDGEILTVARHTEGVPAEASTISALVSARTTARTSLLKVHGMLTDRLNVKHSGRVDVVHRIPQGMNNLSDDELDALEAIATKAQAREHEALA